MSSDTKVYDSNAVDLIAVAIPINDGRAENFVSVRPLSPAFETEVGADGEVTRYATHDNRCTVMVRLKRSSSHNSQLAAIHAADRSSTGGAGLGGFLLKDNTGATLIASDKCWIKQLPEWEMGKAVGDVEWEFEMVLQPEAAFPGGN